MATVQRFEELEVWKLARELALLVYRLTKTGELAKDYRLKDQMNAAAGSVMDNIAEAFGRAGRLEFIQFLSIATGSGDELKSQLYRCYDRAYITKDTFNSMYELSDKFYRKINVLKNYLNQTEIKGQKFKNRMDSK
jgi:four helix bundle protein